MNDNDLKPCPFCGKKAEIKNVYHSGAINLYKVICPTPRCYGSGGNAFVDQESAIKAWNRRKGEQ